MGDLMRFKQARQYYPGRRKPIRVIVLHCTATPRNSTAAGIANYFSTLTRKASAHVTFDNQEGWESVLPSDTAFGASGTNADGYHVEHIGLGTESREDWLDEYAYPMFVLSAKWTADIARQFSIPLRWLSITELRDGRSRGFIDHRTVQRAFPSTGHTDLGPSFPSDVYMDLVRGYSNVTIPPTDEDDMNDQDWTKLTDLLRALIPEPDPNPRVDEAVWPGRGKAVVLKDGAVHCYGVPYFGGVNALKDEHRLGWPGAGAIVPLDSQNPAAGYTVYSYMGARYDFGPDTDPDLFT